MTTSGRKGHLPCVDGVGGCPCSMYRVISIDGCQLEGVRFYHHGEMRGGIGGVAAYNISILIFLYIILSDILI